MMYIELYQKLYARDLLKIVKELESYPDDESLWTVYPQIKNSAGILVQHTIGNLNHYIGKHLGGTDYVRNRDAEFTLRQFERPTLIELVLETISMIEHTLQPMNDKDLEKSYATDLLNFNLSEHQTVNDVLVGLLVHLSYHLGQINYHRRFLATV